MKTYTTVQGDMWDKIAADQLGSEIYVDRLMTANPEHIDTYVFSSGIELTIPDIDATGDVSALPPWKQVSG
ncbi:MAG: tail protein X [Clostridia bacterium]|nr:tail protein X [Clostridia bacterium]